MASVKISALKPLELDRLSDKDVFIVNDQDTTTLKIDFETLKAGLGRDKRAFYGDVEFHGKVDFLGPLAGRTVYTISETNDAIAAALVQPEADIDALEAQQAKTIYQFGTSASTYITNELSGSLLSAGGKTVKDALNALGVGHDDNVILINANGLKIDTNSSAIEAEKVRNDTQDADILELQNIVGVDGAVIDGNTSNITDNANNVGALANVVGVAVGASTIANGTITGGIIEASGNAYSVVTALGTLESSLVTANANIVTLTSDAVAASDVRDEHQARINLIVQTLIGATTGYTGDADGLATAIAAALTALTPLA